MADADLPAVLAIQTICYTQVTPESKESLHAKLIASQSTCLIASLAGETVGYLIALPWEFSNPPALNARTCESRRAAAVLRKAAAWGLVSRSCGRILLLADQVVE